MKTALMLFLFLSLAVAGCSAGSASMGSPGAPAADNTGALTTLSLTDLSGTPLPLGEWVGRDVIVISFWATYCKPCKGEMPFLQKMWEKYGEKGLKVLAVSQDGPETESGVRPFVQRNRYTFHVSIDRQSDAARLLNPKGMLPYLVIVGKDGRIVMGKDGFSAGDQPAIETFLQEQLAK